MSRKKEIYKRYEIKKHSRKIIAREIVLLVAVVVVLAVLEFTLNHGAVWLRSYYGV